MPNSITIRSKGRVTHPKSLRERHHLIEGEVAPVLDSPHDIMIRRGRARLRGMLKGRVDSKALRKALAKLRSEWSG